LHKIRALGLPKEKENLILGGNAARMILHAANPLVVGSNPTGPSENFSGDEGTVRVNHGWR
jgi:hypothetical protein